LNATYSVLGLQYSCDVKVTVCYIFSLHLPFAVRIRIYEGIQLTIHASHHPIAWWVPIDEVISDLKRNRRWQPNAFVTTQYATLCCNEIYLLREMRKNISRNQVETCAPPIHCLDISPGTNKRNFYEITNEPSTGLHFSFCFCEVNLCHLWV